MRERSELLIKNGAHLEKFRVRYAHTIALDPTQQRFAYAAQDDGHTPYGCFRLIAPKQSFTL